MKLKRVTNLLCLGINVDILCIATLFWLCMVDLAEFSDFLVEYLAFFTKDDEIDKSRGVTPPRPYGYAPGSVRRFPPYSALHSAHRAWHCALV